MEEQDSYIPTRRRYRLLRVRYRCYLAGLAERELSAAVVGLMACRRDPDPKTGVQNLPSQFVEAHVTLHRLLDSTTELQRGKQCNLTHPVILVIFSWQDEVVGL